MLDSKYLPRINKSLIMSSRNLKLCRGKNRVYWKAMAFLAVDFPVSPKTLLAKVREKRKLSQEWVKQATSLLITIAMKDLFWFMEKKLQTRMGLNLD